MCVLAGMSMIGHHYHQRAANVSFETRNASVIRKGKKMFATSAIGSCGIFDQILHSNPETYVILENRNVANTCEM